MFIYRNILMPALAKLQAGYALYNRFHSAWGRTTLNGVKVYTTLRYYEGGRYREDTVTKRFVTGIGMSWEEFISQQVDSEITAMWFYLKSDFKWDGSTKIGYPNYPEVESASIPTAEDIAELLNSTFKIGDKIQVSVSYGGALERYLTEHEQEWTIVDGQVMASPLNSARIREILHSKPWYYFGNTNHIEYDMNTTKSFEGYTGNIEFDSSDNIEFKADMTVPVTRIGVTTDNYLTDPLGEELGSASTNLGSFALMGDTSVWEPTLDKDGNIKILQERTKTVSTPGGEALEYQYILEYEYKGCTSNSRIVKEMAAYYDHWMDDTNNIGDTLAKTTLKAIVSNPISTNSLFYRGYLRCDVAKIMKKKDFMRLMGNLDTDYSVKKASFWEKALAVVIIIIAIVVAIFSCLSGCWGFAALGTALAGVGAVLAVGMLILSSLGGLSAQGLVKQIGAFAQIVGYASIICGIGSILTNMATQTAAEVGKQAALDAGLEAGSQAAVELSAQVATEYLKNTGIVQILVDTVKNQITSAMSSISNFVSGTTTWSSQSVLSAFKSGLELFNKGFEYWKDREQDKYKTEAESLDKEIKEMEDMQWEAAYNDVGAYMTKELGKSYDALDELYLKIRRESAEGFHDKAETIGYMQ